jgi:acyl dehydratase
VISCLIAAQAACSGSREHALLDQFFAASRLRDLTALRTVSTVVFEPRERGTVLSYEIKSIEEISGDSKIVHVDAHVRRPDGRIVSQRLLVTISGRMITGVAAGLSTPRS